ncbi:hypothetical protein E6Q11_01800 [Candidatus Dojkabacteria bacterium]|uniref:Phage portal protein n=1 Tax=Candidatus Dojkabacteria bacterium TaxID=2099670 RepID=A0A5C7JA86_9BACT|nr:MAG: hypothetical protein E6Q11_01800 [Candidatus Dojkabacteria bacterium]
MNQKLIDIDPSSGEKIQNADDADRISNLKKYVSDWYSVFNININSARLDALYITDSQWDSSDQANRFMNEKPSLQFNYLYAMVSSILAEHRQNTAEIKVMPTSTSTSEEDVDIRENSIRQITYDNKAPILYQNALQQSLTRGWSAMRVDIEQSKSNPFFKDIKMYGFKQPDAAFFDPTAQMQDKSDGRFCGYFDVLTIDEYKRLYPDADTEMSFPASMMMDTYLESGTFTKLIRIANIYIKEFFTKKMALLSNGQSMDYEKAEEIVNAEKKTIKAIYKIMGSTGQGDEQQLMPQFEPIRIVDEMDVEDYRIMHYRANGDEILEQAEWPCKELPIVFVDCDSHYLDGLQITKSFHRYAKDAQNLLNYVNSEAAYAILSANNTQFIGTDEMIAGYENDWLNPQRKKAILRYKKQADGTKPEPLPPREIPQSLMMIKQQAATDLMAVLGRFEANRGSDGNEPSGVALVNRIKQGNLASFVPIDNLNRAIEQLGRIILRLMPKIYDTTRTIMTMDSNGRSKPEMINNPVAGEYKNDMSIDDFDVMVQVGSNYEIQKAEALAQLKDLYSVLPQAALATADMYGENINIQKSPKLVERLKNYVLPPEILAKESGEQLPPPPPNPETILQQQKLQEEMQKIKNDADKNKLDAQKLQIEYQIALLEAQVQQAKLKAELQKASLDAIGSASKHVADMHKTSATHAKAQADILRGINDVASSTGM